MSKKKSDNFSRLFDYFNGEEEEDSEVEIMNYQDNYNKIIQVKNSKENINNNIIKDGKENNIINKLLSNEEDEEENDVFYYKEKKIIENNDNDFNNFKFTSFKPKELNSSKNSEENDNEITRDNNNNNINNKELIKELENDNNKKEEKNQKIETEKSSFNDIINKSTSIQTEKILENSQYKINQENKIKEEYKPEYLINSKIFDKFENKENIISEKNKIEWKDKNIIIKKNINQLKLYMKKNIKMKKESNKKPIELILYDDAIKKRKKNEIINKNKITENELNSKRSKINKTSYKISIDSNNKKIESIIKKYDINDGLSLIEICLILQELKIFRKLLQNININKLNNINDINEFKNKISIVIKDNEIRKINELEFLEQIYNLLNIQKQKIDSDIFEGFLKILFSSLGNNNDTYNNMQQYIKVIYFGENKDNNLKLIKNCIKNFFNLKENIVAYKNINNYNNEKFIEIIKENERNLTFIPNIEKNYNTIQNKKNFNFDKLYDRFLEKEKDKQNNLNKLRKEQTKKEMKELKKKPTISKYIYNNEYQEEIHDKLYNQGNYIRKKKQEKIKEKEKEEKERLEKELKTYKLNYNSRKNRRRMAKSFDISSKPKGYDEYIIRNRKEILNKEKLKEKIEKIPCGENYDKIRKRNITPFNITDMKKERINKEKDNNYFIMKIKIPNGQMKNLKIYMNSNPFKIANNFCKIYSIKDNTKQKLINNIIECQNYYLNVKNDYINNYDEIL